MAAGSHSAQASGAVMCHKDNLKVSHYTFFAYKLEVSYLVKKPAYTIFATANLLSVVS
jgi:hypothetical protein